MKNKITCLLFVLAVSGTYGQSKDTLVLYDHIIVYDTIKVYDTLFVYDTVPAETFFQKNNIAQNPSLTVDTATKELSLKLFFQNDTATISSNSILLSENTKNSKAMKKEILTLVASAMLSQATYSQSGKMDTLSCSESYSIGAGLVFDETPGVMLKGDYLISKKVSVGIRSHLTFRERYSYSHPAYSIDGVDVPESTTTSTDGPLFNAYLTSTYYIPKRGFCSKVGFYATAGIGYERLVSDAETTNSDNTFKSSQKYSNQNLSVLTCAGVDYKIGRGKVYVDIPVTFVVYNKYERTYESSASLTEKNTTTHFGTPALNWAAITLGYTFYF